MPLGHDRQGFRKQGLSFTRVMTVDLESAVRKLDIGDDWEEGAELSAPEVRALLAYLVSERYRHQHERR